MPPIWPTLSTEAPRLRFGVAGERTFADKDAGSWVRDRFDEIWQVAADVVVELSKTQPRPKLRLAVGMAVGADTIATNSYRAAHASAPDVGHELLLVYPSTPDAFAARSDSSALEDFATRRRELLRAAPDGAAHPAVAELVLDGDLPRSDSKDAVQSDEPMDPALLQREKRIRNAANSAQADALIRQCEFLIAVLDRRKAGEAGGTRGTIELALSLQTPVLLLDPVTRNTFVLSCQDELTPEFTPDPVTAAPADQRRVDWRTVWSATLLKALTIRTAPPIHSEIGSHQRQDPEVQLRAWVFDESTKALLRTPRWERFTSPFKERADRDQAKPRAAAGAADAPAADAPVLPKPTVWSTFTLLLKAVWRWAWARPATPRERVADNVADHWRDQIAEAQGHAMEAYRSVFLSNYLLGVSAVLLAVCAFGILACTGLKPGPASLGVLLAITVAKLLIVMRISHNTHRAEKGDYAGHAVGLRYLAERLRILPTLLLAGSSRVDLQHQTPRRGAPHHVLEDICRRLPLDACAAAHDRHQALGSLNTLLDRQISYHSDNLARMQLLHQHLNHAVQLAGKAVIGIVIVDLLVLSLKGAVKLYAFDTCLSPATVQQFGSVLGVAGLICVALTALLPALMATLNAIQFQSQAEQLAERHGAMGAALRVLKGEAQALEQRLDNPGASRAVLALCERTAGLLAEEVAEWATMYRQGVKES